MAHFNKEKALATIKSGDMDDIQALLDDIEERLNTKKYGLIWEHGGNDENSPFEPEYVVLDCQRNILCPKLNPDLSAFPEKANGNILLEGDNYIWLKILEQTHANQIQFIYIDLPYNTGHNDFRYNDRFVKEDDLFRHSMWLDVMEHRISIARNLLTDDGVIFVSIDDREQHALRFLMNDIFGEQNFVASFVWKKKRNRVGKGKSIVKEHEYILCYQKDAAQKVFQRDSFLEHKNIESKYPLYDEETDQRYMLNPLDSVSLGYSDDRVFPINHDGKEYWPIDKNGKKAVWRWGKEKVENEYADLVFQGERVYSKSYASKEGMLVGTILPENVVGYTQMGTQDLNNLGLVDFPYPKPVMLIKDLLNFYYRKDITVLDFFAGSGTTAQAVEELNQEDGGRRKWILITNNENQDEDDDDPETGICRDITKPRIDTVITGIRPDGSKYSDGTNSGYQYFQCDFMPRFETREANQRAFFTPTKNIDAVVRIKYGVVLKELDRDRMAMIYENDDKQLIVFIKDVDDELLEEFFDDEHERHIVLANDIVDVDGIESDTIHSLIPSYEFFM